MHSSKCDLHTFRIPYVRSGYTPSVPSTHSPPFFQRKETRTSHSFCVLGPSNAELCLVQRKKQLERPIATDTITSPRIYADRWPRMGTKLTKLSNSYVILDTPGQIEIFTWSASGAIITDAVASTCPTVVAYVIDTPRTTAPATFMSNMLYACR